MRISSFLFSFIHPVLHFKSKNWFFRLKQPYFETDVPVHVLKYLEIFLSNKAISLFVFFLFFYLLKSVKV